MSKDLTQSTTATAPKGGQYEDVFAPVCARPDASIGGCWRSHGRRTGHCDYSSGATGTVHMPGRGLYRELSVRPRLRWHGVHSLSPRRRGPAGTWDLGMEARSSLGRSSISMAHRSFGVWVAGQQVSRPRPAGIEVSTGPGD